MRIERMLILFSAKRQLRQAWALKDLRVVFPVPKALEKQYPAIATCLSPSWPYQLRLSAATVKKRSQSNKKSKSRIRSPLALPSPIKVVTQQLWCLQGSLLQKMCNQLIWLMSKRQPHRYIQYQRSQKDLNWALEEMEAVPQGEAAVRAIRKRM